MTAPLERRAGDPCPVSCGAIVCRRTDTQLVEGMPLCATHRATLAHYGRLHVAGALWLGRQPDDPTPLPATPAGHARHHVDDLNATELRRARASPRPLAFEAPPPEPIDPATIARPTLF